MATGEDAVEVTTSAIESAREQLSETDTLSLAVVLSSPQYDPELITETMTDILGDVPIVGSTTAGEFTDEGVTDGGIVVALIESDSMETVTTFADGVSEDVFGTVQKAVDGLPDAGDLSGEHTAAVTFHNGLAGKGEEITLVTNQLLGDVPLAGGSAGDDLALEETTVFTEDGVSSDGVAIAMLSSEEPFGLAASHGHTVLSDTYEVTKADGNVIHELDGDPAYDVWKREIADVAADEYDVDMEELSADDDEFATLLNQFEIGIPTGEDTHKIRWPAMTDSTDGSLKFATGVPEGSEVKIMHSPKAEQIDSARDAARESLQSFEGEDVAGALVFDCVCRGLILGDEFEQAVDAMTDEIGAPIAGFETYGEICMPPDAASGYHNTTTSVLLVPQ